MKNIRKYIGAALLSLALGSCHVADVSEYATLSDVSWYLSYSSTVITSDELDKTDMDRTVYLSQNGRLVMMDLSQGMNSHQWIVEEHESIKFIEGSLSTTSPSTEEIEAMVVEKDYTNSDKTVRLWFTEAGEFTVKLLNKFPYEAGFTYNSNIDWRDYTITADEVNGEWVWEETFNIKVYGSTMTPAVEVYRDAEYTDMVELGTAEDTENGIAAVHTQVNLNFGDTLYFKDVTEGEPDSWIWKCEDISTASTTTQNVAYTFNTTISTEDDPTLVTFKPGRAANSTYSMSTVYSVVTLTVPLDIIVSANVDAPVEAEAPVLVHNSDGSGYSQTIQFRLKNAMIPSGKTFSQGAFKVKYTPIDGVEATDSQVTGSTSATGLVTLATTLPLYNTDKIELVYEGASFDVENNGTMVGETFVASKFDSSIEIPTVETCLNEVIVYDFEDDAQLDEWQIALGNASNTIVALSDRYFNIVDDPTGATNENGEVNRCLMIKTEGAGLSSPLLQQVATPFTGDIDTYTISFKFYNTVGNSDVNLTTRMLSYPYTYNSYITWGGDWATFSSESFGVPNIWRSETGTEVGTMVLENMKLAFCLNAYSGTLYLDNILVTNAETR